ncbi:ATP-binding cassette domain-containing protein, partial [Pseudomonas sp. BGM005]|nr:ATP-binding cassette domain-containing protein [Pseudomonas sp. BG5]
QLSGGQRQRVALARALAPRPSLLLLDEPFSALEESFRVPLRRSFRQLQRALGQTCVLVTHDRDEAFELADQVAVMADGRIEQ